MSGPVGVLIEMDCDCVEMTEIVLLQEFKLEVPVILQKTL